MSTQNNGSVKPARLRISANRRFLIKEDGSPFFYLGDTAWLLYHRLTHEEVAAYLRARAQQGFTVIQTSLLGERQGLTEPNRYGHRPLEDDDPDRPNEAYLRHVDYVVDRAESLGLYIALAPAWGIYVVGGTPSYPAPRLFTADSARRYGEFLGARYRHKSNVIWLVGGDREPVRDGVDYSDVWRALADGLRTGGQGTHLMTFHPPGGGRSSSLWFHQDEWLDFNMMQTGPRRRDWPNYETIARDYALTPTKPAMDGEPGYERAYAGRQPEDGRYTDYDVRKFAYWALFAGAHGHTYGCLEIWQFYVPDIPGRLPFNGAELPWQEAVPLPGALQMRHVRRLLESRPFLVRVPDQSIVLSDAGSGTDRIQATRGADGSYALLYSAAGSPFTVDLGKLSGSRARAWWFDPRRGTASALGEFPTAAPKEFVPPSSGPGNDWVLVLDAAARQFPVPGADVAAG